MKRDAIAVVAAKGAFTGKPRPVLVVQSDLFNPYTRASRSVQSRQAASMRLVCSFISQQPEAYVAGLAVVHHPRRPWVHDLRT